jgi:hypothetical protein
VAAVMTWGTTGTGTSPPPPRDIYSGTPATIKGKLPNPSDVVFSTRFARANSLDNLTLFNATRCEWLYSDDPRFVREVRRHVRHVGLAVRSNPSTPASTGAALGVRGQPLIAPWQTRMGFEWGTSLRKPTRDAVTEWINRCAELGADSIQLDDPSMEFGAAIFSGGDYSQEALRAFRVFAQASPQLEGTARQELAANGWNMAHWVLSKECRIETDWPQWKPRYFLHPVWETWRSFLRATTQEFLLQLRRHVHQLSSPIALSMNIEPLPTANNAFLLDKADYFVSEISSSNALERISVGAATAAAFGVPLVTSLTPAGTSALRAQIAFAYASGALALAPWDIYVGSMSGDHSRFYGDPSDFRDLYAFVRAHPQNFDGWKPLPGLVVLVDTASLDAASLLWLVARLMQFGVQFQLVAKTAKGVVGLKASGQKVVAIPLGMSEAVTRDLLPANSIILRAGEIQPAHPALKYVPRWWHADRDSYRATIRSRGDKILIHVVRTGEPLLTTEQDTTLGFHLPSRLHAAGRQIATMYRPDFAPERLEVNVETSEEFGHVTLPVPVRGTWFVFIIGE